MPNLSDLGSFLQILVPYPVWVKLSLGATVVFACVSGLGLIFAAPAKPAAAQPTPSGPITHTVTSYNQTNGITAHTINQPSTKND